MYQGDQDDLNPLQCGYYPGTGWDWFDVADVPYNWWSGGNAVYQNVQSTGWANSIQPYLKNYAIYNDPVQVVQAYPGEAPYLLQTNVPYGTSNYTFNGLLSQYSGTAVAAPSKLISFWSGFGTLSIPGESIAIPNMKCPNPNEPCAYRPPAPNCAASTDNGATSTTISPNVSWGIPTVYTAWMYGKGMNYAYADGHVAWHPIGANINIPTGGTDYKLDPWGNYTSSGYGLGQWAEQDGCHPLLFRPDFDFTDYGTPVLQQ
jgi:prepilin-type processing-associated H-X9-DG protein